MATRSELNLQLGNVVIWVDAQRKTSDGIETGIPVNTPKANVFIGVGQVVEIGRQWTKLQTIYKYPHEISRRETVGEIKKLNAEFNNLLDDNGKGDEKLQNELLNAGFQINIRRYTSNFVIYEVSRNQRKTKSDDKS